MKVVGVTGGIGSGKSSLCRMLESFGARVFYADAEAKRLMNEDPEIRRRLKQAFGSETFGADGRINRAYLAGRIFSDPEARRRMNDIVHPAVRAAFRDFVDEALRSGAPVVVREAALITGTEHELDEVVVVEAPERVRIRRVAERDDVDEAAVRARIDAQPARSAFRDVADRIVVNDGSVKDLEREALRLWKEWTSGDG